MTAIRSDSPKIQNAGYRPYTGKQLGQADWPVMAQPHQGRGEGPGRRSARRRASAGMRSADCWPFGAVADLGGRFGVAALAVFLPALLGLALFPLLPGTRGRELQDYSPRCPEPRPPARHDRRSCNDDPRDPSSRHNNPALAAGNPPGVTAPRRTRPARPMSRPPGGKGSASPRAYHAHAPPSSYSRDGVAVRPFGYRCPSAAVSSRVPSAVIRRTPSASAALATASAAV